jgi:chorismate dehydratase
LGGRKTLGTLRIGAPGYVSARPLIYGLMEQARKNVVLTYADPGDLAESLERGQLDAALIPSIEFLRGVGSYYVDGPGVVTTGKTGGIVLVAARPVGEVKRIAVFEKCRTPLAALRFVLDGLYNTLPDFCVYKGPLDNWAEYYDGILLDGDNGIGYCRNRLRDGETCHDIGELWCTLFPAPLVLSLWAYNDHRLTDTLGKLLTDSRDYGMKNLSMLADGVARTGDYDSQFLYKYFATGWRYDLGPQEQEGLRLLQEHALRYQLIQRARLGGMLQRQP